MINNDKKDLIKNNNLVEAERLIQEGLKCSNSDDFLFNLGYIYELKKESKLASYIYALARKSCLVNNKADHITEVINILNDTREKKSIFEKKIIIFDDYFPNVKTGFRVAEYNYYLNNYPNSIIYSFNPYFDYFYKEYINYYPQYKNRVLKFCDDKNFDQNMESCTLCYTVFINNAFNYLPYFEKYNKPFIFTLYPGGGFDLYIKETDRKLNMVCKSKLLKKIIVTQSITNSYILDNRFSPIEKVEFIFGGVTHLDLLNIKMNNKKLYKKDKATFDVCFVSGKYMNKGLDKGYDIFIEVCRQLSKMLNDIRFHIVGGFDRNELDVSEFEDKIVFYGMRNEDFFEEFYKDKDIILSPNLPYKLYPGGFDGFPTTCCVDAALNGTAVFCTDELGLNNCFENEKHLCIISTDVNEIVKKVNYYYNNPKVLYDLSLEGQSKFKEIFSESNQMEKRIKIIEQFL